MMILELAALLCTGLFAGAALYVSLVEHPARLEGGPALAIAQFGPSYRRGAVMQASLAGGGCLAAVAAWVQGSPTPVLIAGVLLGSSPPASLAGEVLRRADVVHVPIERHAGGEALRRDDAAAAAARHD